MKKQFILSAVVLFIVTGIAGCKKDSGGGESFKKMMIGQWQVAKIEVNTYNADGTVAGTTATDYTSSDYMDFQDSEENELELSLGGVRTSGSYVIFDGEKFNASFPSRLLYCTTDHISETSFQFTGTVDQSNPKVTETYYLVR